MRAVAGILSIGACVVAVLATTGCANTPPSGPSGESSTTAPPAGSEQPAQQKVMPDLVGRGLQDAQDLIQAVTGNPVFLTRSHDVSGRQRSQTLDANWKVCSQNVEPGAPLTADSLVEFGVVKLDETCP